MHLVSITENNDILSLVELGLIHAQRISSFRGYSIFMITTAYLFYARCVSFPVNWLILWGDMSTNTQGADIVVAICYI